MNTQQHSRPAPTHWRPADAAHWLAPPRASDYKRSRGVLGARIGSSQFPGAAVLGVTAAWRMGLGMLRYVVPFEREGRDGERVFGQHAPAAAVLAARPETLFGPGECDAWLLGSGTELSSGHTKEATLIARLHDDEAPLVVDAGALESALNRTASSAPAVLTPHLGEFRRLWAAAHLGPLPQQSIAGSVAVPHDAVALLAGRLSATILLKGSTSTIANPGGCLIAVGPATPWLATAGTGDVLAGILGALVARHASELRADPDLLAPVAATAALVHDTAARIASQDETTDPARCVGLPITALDVANAVPEACRRLSY